ncbi:hypothetical protein [Winogradskya consettensis]|nr:hypothetical protein [Actinoplanes consettensis]
MSTGDGSNNLLHTEQFGRIPRYGVQEHAPAGRRLFCFIGAGPASRTPYLHVDVIDSTVFRGVL